MQVSLAGKTAIVTGAASGIGAAIVRQYLESEIDGVVAVDVAARPSGGVFQPGSDRLAYVEGDVALEATAQEFVRTAVERFGRIDILVNNAGVALAKPLHEHTPEQWDRVMNVNAKAIYWAARHVIPVMIQQRSGVILNTGSISGQVGIPGQGAMHPPRARCTCSRGKWPSNMRSMESA